MDLDLIHNCDCLEGMKALPDGCVDLVIMDPPYDITNVNAGEGSRLSRSISRSLGELEVGSLRNGFQREVLDEVVRVCAKPNIYIFCNRDMIPDFLDYFTRRKGYVWEMLVWFKTNAVPTYWNKYLTDKEYCLYFRKGGHCRPQSYEDARTVWTGPINKKDKDRWHHPTIKPLDLIRRMIRNSSVPGQVVLDPYMGSGTTAVAALLEGRRYIGFEMNAGYCKTAEERIAEALQGKQDTVSTL